MFLSQLIRLPHVLRLANQITPLLDAGTDLWGWVPFPPGGQFCVEMERGRGRAGPFPSFGANLRGHEASSNRDT